MLCLSAGAISATLAVAQFTLAWQHSIEKTRWEEDWRIADGRLQLMESRIQGSGAGMEPPAEAQLRDGVWHYRPPLPAQSMLRLSHSPYTAAYELCITEGCQPLANLLPKIAPHAIIELRPCPP